MKSKKQQKKADAHDFTKRLPMQYYTYLEEAGTVGIGVGIVIGYYGLRKKK